MIAANDTPTTFLTDMAPDQLRLVIAHASGLLAHHTSDFAAHEALSHIARSILRPRITMADIAEKVAAEHGLTLAELRAATQKHWAARLRHQAFWEIHNTGRYSNGQIAAFFGLKDHSTVTHGRQRHAARLQAGEGV